MNRGGRSGGYAVEVVLVSVFDADLDDIARLETASVAQVDFAVDFRRVGLGAAGSADGVVMWCVGRVEMAPVRHVRDGWRRIDPVDEDLDGRADLGGELLGGNAGGEGHDPLIAFLLDLLRHRVGQRVGGGALDRLELEGADTIEPRLLQPV